MYVKHPETTNIFGFSVALLTTSSSQSQTGQWLDLLLCGVPLWYMATPSNVLIEYMGLFENRVYLQLIMLVVNIMISHSILGCTLFSDKPIQIVGFPISSLRSRDVP